MSCLLHRLLHRLHYCEIIVLLTISTDGLVLPVKPVAGRPGMFLPCDCFVRLMRRLCSSPARRARSRSRSMSPRSSRSRSPREDRRRNRSRTPLNGSNRYNDGGAAPTSHSGRESQDKRVYVGNLSYEVKWPQLKDYLRTGMETIFQGMRLICSWRSSSCRSAHAAEWNVKGA
jgi:hypothetical protein